MPHLILSSSFKKGILIFRISFQSLLIHGLDCLAMRMSSSLYLLWRLGKLKKLLMSPCLFLSNCLFQMPIWLVKGFPLLLKAEFVLLKIPKARPSFHFLVLETSKFELFSYLVGYPFQVEDPFAEGINSKSHMHCKVSEISIFFHTL